MSDLSFSKKPITLISGIGPDQPGIVLALCDVLFRHDCNIVDTTMTRLGGQFAIILIVELPDGVDMQALQEECALLEGRFGLKAIIRDIDNREDKRWDWSKSTPYMISVTGVDQTGITYQVSKCLSEHEVNVTDLNAKIIGGDENRPVYMMMLEVDILPQTSLSALEKELQAIGKALNVEVSMRPIEAVVL